MWEATGKTELGMRTERVPDLNELLNFPWVPSPQVQLRPQINATAPWLSNPISFLIFDEQKKRTLNFLVKVVHFSELMSLVLIF